MIVKDDGFARFSQKGTRFIGYLESEAKVVFGARSLGLVFVLVV